MRNTLLILAFIATLATPTFAQHDIHLKINGLKNVSAYLGRYIDDKTNFCDTAKVNQKGELIFEGNESLSEGLYFVALDQTKLFEFVVGENQYFDMETNTADYVKNMKVQNDEDNMIFFESLLFNMELYKQAEPLLKTIQDETVTADKKRIAQMSLNKIRIQSIAYQDEIIENYPNTTTAKLFKSARETEVSGTQSKADDTNSASQRLWYQSHFGLF